MMESRPTETRVVELLEELVVWTRFIARAQLEGALRSALTDPKRQAAYELTDGERSQSEIASLVGIDQSTVSDFWARWRRLGLIREIGRRPKHLVRLTDLGWTVPTEAAATPGRAKGRASADRPNTGAAAEQTAAE
jgi:hypothetical protein